ncbi:MAG: nucleotidyltransferase domain-containing protein [Comamonadaceae bacterium]|nr:nucleotidyltransferase domain-containing protein [Comamonadaceae bacterium]
MFASYTRGEPSWYQAVDLEERRDVIEYPIVDDIDLNGWDVRKALRLYWKSTRRSWSGFSRRLLIWKAAASGLTLLAFFRASIRRRRASITTGAWPERTIADIFVRRSFR